MEIAKMSKENENLVSLIPIIYVLYFIVGFSLK